MMVFAVGGGVLGEATASGGGGRHNYHPLCDTHSSLPSDVKLPRRVLTRHRTHNATWVTSDSVSRKDSEWKDGLPSNVKALRGDRIDGR
jgi:hypothetical protein